jgi:hypothetical protein
MKRKFLRGLFLVGFAWLMWGCYPGGAEYYDDYDVVYTNYDKEHTFTGHKNYAIADKIVKITGNSASEKPPEYVSAIYATPMLERMKTNMNAMGYTLVTDINNADVALMPAAVEVTNVTYWYDWWYGYWGWYGWYYPYPITYSYKSGSLFMNLVDAKTLSPDGKHPVIWSGICNGLLEGSTSDITARMTKSIDQAFKQSAYLHQ